MGGALRKVQRSMTTINLVLVEDNSADVILAGEFLKQVGIKHNIQVLEDGEEAIEYFKSLAREKPFRSPDLVVIDLNLPKRSGHEVLEEIRKLPILDNLPVVVLTTSETPEDRNRAASLNILRYATKPLDQKSLRLILDSLNINWYKSGNQIETETRKEPENYGELCNILLVEDNPSDVVYMQELLKDSFIGDDDLHPPFRLTNVEDLSSAIERLQAQDFSIILADLGLPDANGLETVNLLRKTAPEVPVVILTGLDDEELAVEAVEQGSQDYLVKGKVDAAMLGRSIRYAITRKKAEQLAHMSVSLENSVLQEILENAPLAIVRFDRNLTVTACNSSFANQIGIASRLVMGKKISDLLPNLEDTLWQRTILSGLPVNRSNVSPIEDRDLVWEMACWPIKAKDTVKGGIIAALDVTAKVLMERKRDDLVASLAHDIRNPLLGTERVLKLFLEETFGPLKDEQAKVIQLLRDSTADVLSILQNLVDIYRYENNANLHFEPVDLDATVNQVILQIKAQTEEKNITISKRIDSPLDSVYGDTRAIERMLCQLLTNTLQFCEPASEINIELKNQPKQVSIRIISKGLGMTEKELDFLFKRFGQAKSTQYRVGPGTGLGLYLCKQIVDVHQGMITCHCTGGRTTFEIQLPACKK